MGFSDDIKSRNTTLFPIVTIGDDDPIRISTNSVTVSEAYYKPLLLNVPSLKESIDIEKRNYKISNVTLDISNYECEGVRFSDMVADSSLINQEVNIYWVSQSDEKLIYKGRVRRYTHDDEKVKLVVEDRSQGALEQDVFYDNNSLDDSIEIPDKYKNKPYPMVFGKVDKSPCVISSSPYVGDAKEGENDTVVNSDIDDSGNVFIEELYIFLDDNYIFVPETAEYKFDYQSGENWTKDKAKAKFDTVQESENNDSEDSIVLGNAVANNNLIIYQRSFITEVAPIHDVKIKSWSDVDWWSGANSHVVKDGDKYVVSGTMVDFRGTTSLDWSKTSLTQEFAEENDFDFNDIDGAIEFDDGKPDHLQLGTVLKIGNPRISSNIVNGNEKGFATIKFQIGLLKFENDESFRVKVRAGGHADGDHTSIVYEYLYQTNEPSNSAFPNYDYPEATQEMIEYKCETNFNELCVYLHPEGDNVGAVGATLKFNEVFVDYYAEVKKIDKLDFYADVNGRNYSESSGLIIPNKATDAIITILDRMGIDNYVAPEYPESSGYWGWSNDFTVHKNITAKKLIEQIASTSAFIPRFNHEGEFKFDIIRKNYNGDEVDHLIEESDCIKWSYSKTKIEDVYSKIEFNYNLDYARDNFTKKEILDISQLNQFIDFDINQYFEYYGLPTDHSESTLLIDDHRGRYIRNEETAKEFVRWLLYWHCNQHLKIKLKLPLKYLNIEIGSLIGFDKVLGGINPYGIDYSQEAKIIDDNGVFDPVLGQYMNFSHLHPLFMCISTNKTLEFIEIECIQLHSLSDVSIYGLAGSMKLSEFGETPLNFNPDATFSDGSEIYVSNFVVDGCPFEYHPSGDLAGDESVIDESANYVHPNLLIQDNVFTGTSINDPAFQEGGEVYNFLKDYGEVNGFDSLHLLIPEYSLNTSPTYDEDSVRILLGTNCEWTDIEEHNINTIQILDNNGEPVAGGTVSSANFENVDYTNLNVPSSIFNIDDFITVDSEGNHTINWDAQTNINMKFRFANFSYFPDFAGGASVDISSPTHFELINGEWIGGSDPNEEYSYSFEIVIRWNLFFESIAFNPNLTPEELHSMMEDYAIEYMGGYASLPLTVRVYLNDIILDGTNYTEEEFILKLRFNFGVEGQGTGDMNQDGNLDVLDVMMLVDAVLSSDQTALGDGDVNQDGNLNVLDVMDLTVMIFESNE